MAKPPGSTAPRKQKAKVTNDYVKYYLVAYNALSGLAWGYVLVTLLLHLTGLPASTSAKPLPHKTAAATLQRFIASLPVSYFKSAAPAHYWIEARLPAALVPLFQRATTAYAVVGPATTLVQTVAVLEVVHSALGWVASPPQTTAMQVASRLFAVWGVVEPYEVARTSPIYATMVLAWSLTEVVRYPFYAAGLLGYKPYFLLWLRYTTFYVLYPLGAGSEAFLNYLTLPRGSPVPSLRSWALGTVWLPYDFVRGALLLLWPPALYFLYTYMIRQRRKVLGTGGRRLGEKPKSL